MAQQEIENQAAILEQWQIEVIKELIDKPLREMEADERIYTSSVSYGSSRYHIINKRYEGVQIEQIIVDEQWPKRVNFYEDELPELIATLLKWHLAAEKDKRDEAARRAAAAASGDDDLGDLDDHPF